MAADSAPLPAQPRLLTPTDIWGLIAPAVLPAWDGALAKVKAAYGEAAPVTVALESFEAMYWAFRYIQGREAWMTDGAFIERYAPVLGPGVKERFAWSKEVTDEQVVNAHAFRTRFRQHLAAMLGSDGVLVMPTMPDVAPLRSTDEAALETYRNNAVQMLCMAGLSGFPQISLPLANRNGAPLGLSLLGPAGSDKSLIAMAQKIAAVGT